MYNFQCCCTSCQIPTEKDFWKCQNSPCNGCLSEMLEIDLVTQFTERRGNASQNQIGTALEEYSGILSVPTIANNSLACSLCKNNVQKSVLLCYANDIVNAFQRYKSISSSSSSSMTSSSMDKVNSLLVAYEKAKLYTTNTSYCLYEILSSLCLELLSMGMFDKLLPYSETLCALASSIYPYRHPQVSVFYLQHAKLLRYLYGFGHKDFNSFFERASSYLRISHPSCHDIFTILGDIQ